MAWYLIVLLATIQILGMVCGAFCFRAIDKKYGRGVPDQAGWIMAPILVLIWPLALWMWYLSKK